jgi:hypothetical protein
MSLEHLSEALRERLEEDAHLLRAAARFVVEKILAAAETRARQSRAAPTPAQRTARRAQEAAQVTKLVEKVREVAVLDMPMPNGQQLRFCRGSEVALWGAGFSRIAAKVGPDCLVGEVVTEAEAAAWARHEIETARGASRGR